MSETPYEDGLLSGNGKTYYQSGELKIIDFFDGGQLIKQTEYDEEGRKTAESLMVECDQPAA